MIGLRDITDLIDIIKNTKIFSDNKEFLKTVNKKVGKSGLEGSIYQKAKNSILQFPVIISSNINIDNVILVKRALEVEYATMLKIAMDLNNIVDDKSPEAKQNFISRFHQNITSNGGLNDQEFNNLLNSENSINDLLQSESIKDLIIENLYPYENNFNKKILSDIDILEEKSNNKDIFMSSEVKKANELVPTIMSIGIEYKVGNDLKCLDIILGIQCVIHPVATEEILYFIPNSLKNQNLILRFVQLTTGEIKFFKDFLFLLDQIKNEAIKSSKSSRESSHWWRKLQMLAKSNKIRTFFNAEKNLIPTSSIIISMDESQVLKNKYAIDLMNPNFAFKLMQTFFLLNFGIVDETSELFYLFDDINKVYKVYSFDSLKKDFNNNTNNKDLIKTIVSLSNR